MPKYCTETETFNIFYTDMRANGADGVTGKADFLYLCKRYTKYKRLRQ